MKRLDMDASSQTAGPALRVAAEFERLRAAPLEPGLYIVSTPIGNLGDITLRALSVLARADVIRCEDTRHTRALLTHFGISVPLRPYHEHNAAAERPRILADLAAGKAVALVSDAGTPLVSDPGYKLVRDALAAGVRVESVPGPSAALAALTCSGLPTDTFLFAGFLPPKTAARRARLAELANVPATLVLFEAPSRVADTMADLAAVLGPRQGAVARELTKIHEEVVAGRLDALASRLADREIKGEVVILVAPGEPGEIADDLIRSRLSAALREASLRDAAKKVADELGVARTRVYDLALALKREGGS